MRKLKQIICTAAFMLTGLSLKAGKHLEENWWWKNIETATGLTAGNYSVTVTDANACTTTTNVTVTTFPVLALSTTATNVSCYGNGNGAINLTVGGGTTPFSYLWNNTANTEDISDLTAGTYTVTVIDGNSCSKTASVTITEPAALTLETSFTVDCAGGNNATATATATGGTTAYSYLWGNSATTATISGLAPATYSVTVTDANGCKAKASVLVPAYCAPAGVFIPNSNNLCNATNFGGSFNGGNVLINGIYTIKGSTQFNNDTIYFGPNAKIVIPEDNLYPTALQFSNCILQAGCNYMWDGIYVHGTNNTVSFEITNTARDAENLIVSVNGGKYQTYGTNYFYDNHICVKVKPYSGTHSGIIQGATIATLNKLIAPRSHERTAIGIEITDVDNISIGVPGSAINIFQNIDVGIKCMNTSIATRNLTVQHNKFENIKAKICEATIGGKPCQPSPGIAVWVLGPNEDGTSGFSPSIEEYVTVGGPNANQSNEFNWCGTGIKVEPMYQTPAPGQVIYTRANVMVERNKFTNIMPVATQISATAVFVRKLWSGNVTVKNHNSQNSYFRSVHTGVRIIDPIGQVEFTIENNNFNSLNSGDGSAAVIIANAFPMAMASTVHVKNNLIQKMNVGIVIRNFTMMEYPVKVYNNTIPMNQSITNSSPVRYGILIENSNALIENNTIKRTSAAPSALLAHKLRGIQISNSQSAIVMNNKLQKMGDGIYCKDNNNNSQLECNIFGVSGVNNSGCVNGFVLDNATIGNQGVNLDNTTYPTDNQWFGMGSNWRINGINNTFTNWYYRDTYSQYDPIPLNGNILTFSLASSSFAYNCDIGCLNPPCKQKKLAGGVNNQTAYISYVQENQYMEKENIFAQLRKDPTLMQLGTADDALLQQFHDSVLLTNMGKIREVHEHISEGNLMLAEQKNSSIVPENLMQENHKKVNDVYLRTWAKAEFEFTPADKTTLESVAYQKPIEGGKAVYMARVMLDILPDDEAVMARMANPEEKEELIVLKNGSFITKVYPNPNNGNMQIDYHLNADQEGEIIIYDFTGKIISSHTLLRENTSLQIKENLANGVYHYRIFVNKEVVSSEKLVIIR